MFGLRGKRKAAATDWRGLLSLLEDDDRRAAAERAPPDGRRESFLGALRRISPTDAAGVLSAGRRLHSATELVDRPTVAIAGMLNSGKTSLVATFLSESGRGRCPRGVAGPQGTHRFVLWLPSAWKGDIELWGLLLSRIGDALGHAPEMLSEDPQRAHAQYNNADGGVEALGIPLVATDPGLDRAGIGLLDCPDIVSTEALGLGSPAERRQMLGKAAMLCSAFLVVTTPASLRDTTLAELLRIAADLMPGVPRLLAVNQVRPNQTPEQVLANFSPLARSHGVDTIYAAYDFEVPASGPFIPDDSRRLVGGRESEERAVGAGHADTASVPELRGLSVADGGEPLPVFFSLETDPERNPPASIGPDRLLRALPAQLDRGQLFERFRLALEAGLRTAVWDHGLAKIERDAERSQTRSLEAQRCLLEVAFDFFAHRDVGGEVTELRLHQSERIVRQLSESFAATAPWYARWGVRLNATMRRVFGGAGDLIRQLTPTATARRSAGQLQAKFRRGEYGGLLTPSRLAKAIGRHGGASKLSHFADRAAGLSADALADADEQVTPPVWAEAVEAVIARYERDDFTSLDPKRLDEAVREMWRQVPMRRKLATGLTPMVALMATFGSVLMLPISFGTDLLFYASIPELFAAAGLTTLSAMWAGGKNSQNVGMQAAKQQLADFHVVLCDAFGVPRPETPQEIMVAETREVLPPAQIRLREPVGPALAVYRIRDEFRQELARHLPRSGPADP